MLRVTHVQPLDDYRLQITFNDGVIRDVDFTEELDERATGTLLEPLRDLDYFRQVRVDHESRTIIWPNGLDPDPDVLHGDFEPASQEAANRRRSLGRAA